MNSNEINKKAWNHHAYDAWIKRFGQPEEEAKKIKEQPTYPLRRYMKYFDDLDGCKMLCPLGSMGRRSLAFSLLGAHVTHIDFSEENIKYGQEMANAIDESLTFICDDFMNYHGENFDICFMEGGILHYFLDLPALSKHVRSQLKTGGSFILNDFHPFRKVFSQRDIFASDTVFKTEGNYFDTDLHHDEVAFDKLLDDVDCHKCELRYYTISEILNAFIKNGFVLEHIDEGPRFDEHKHLPGDFTIVLKAI